MWWVALIDENWVCYRKRRFAKILFLCSQSSHWVNFFVLQQSAHFSSSRETLFWFRLPQTLERTARSFQEKTIKFPFCKNKLFSCSVLTDIFCTYPVYNIPTESCGNHCQCNKIVAVQHTCVVQFEILYDLKFNKNLFVQWLFCFCVLLHLETYLCLWDSITQININKATREVVLWRTITTVWSLQKFYSWKQHNGANPCFLLIKFVSDNGRTTVYVSNRRTFYSGSNLILNCEVIETRSWKYSFMTSK